MKHYGSIVNQHIEATIRILQIIPECINTIVIIDIQLIELRIQTLFFQFTDSIQATGGIASRQINISIVLLAEGFDNGKADTLVSTSYLNDNIIY